MKIFRFEVGKYYVSKLLWGSLDPKKCLTVREALYGGFAKCQYATFAGIIGEYIANQIQFREATEGELLKMQMQDRFIREQNKNKKFYAIYFNGEVHADLKRLAEISKN